jgi:vanillate O-demethylase monooxygenase subunit
MEQWYVAAFSREVGTEPLARRCLGLPIVLYRTEAGEPVALLDRCPHRGMPLSNGKVIGDRVQCAYHGFEFDGSGRCVRIPTESSIPSAMKVHSFPAVERWQWVWVWFGDPDNADPALIPDHHDLGLTDPAFYAEPGVVLEVACNYLMVIENFTDYAHVPYLHGATDAPFVTPQVEVDGPKVTITTMFPNEQSPTFLPDLIGLSFGLVNRMLRYVINTPHVATIVTGIEDLEDPARPKCENRWVSAYTPVAPGVTRAFACLTKNYPEPIPNWWENYPAMMDIDFIPLTEIQRRFDEMPEEERRELSVTADAGHLEVRKIVAKMLAAEAGR